MRRIGLLVAAVLLIAFASYFAIRKNCCGERLDDGQIQELERAAAHGDVAAMKRLYFFFDESEQPAKAEVWLKRAADAGDAEAELHLSERLNATGDPGQQQLALTYLHRSAEHGSSTAQTMLGERYRDGAGVTKNAQTARSWFQKGARAGNPGATLALCNIAAAERDMQQCRECLTLQDRALASVQPKSYYASQLQEQRKRIKGVLSAAP